MGKRVDWLGHASDRRVVQYYDPKPHETLEFSLGQAHALFTDYSRLHVDGLTQETVFSTYIENDWSSRYVTRNTFIVEGNKQLFFTRFKAIGTPATGSGVLSLVDFKIVAQEVLDGGGTKELIRIPAYNGEQEKGFLLFFSPPVSDDRPRTTVTEFGIEREFAKTLEKDIPDFLSYTVPRRAQDYRVNLLLEVFVRHALPHLRFETQFGHALRETGSVQNPFNKQVYRRLEVAVPNVKVGTTQVFEVRIQRDTEGAPRL